MFLINVRLLQKDIKKKKCATTSERKCAAASENYVHLNALK